MTLLMDNTWIVNITAKLCIFPKKARNINAFTTTPQEDWSYHITWEEKRVWDTLVNAAYYLCLWNAFGTLCTCYWLCAEKTSVSTLRMGNMP